MDNNIRTIVIGNDHAALQLKKDVTAHLEEKGYSVVNVGTDTPESCNYPVYALKAANMVVSGEADAGILICGTGVGMSLAANKVDGVRCCVCSEPYSARLSKQHNNTNMLAFGARVVGTDLALMIVDEWLEAQFMGGRHADRVAMVMQIQDKQTLEEA